MNASRKTKSNVFLDFVKGTVVFSNGLLFYPLHVKLDKLDEDALVLHTYMRSQIMIWIDT